MGVATLLSENGMPHEAISGEKERSMPLIKTWLDGEGEEEEFFLQLTTWINSKQQTQTRNKGMM